MSVSVSVSGLLSVGPGRSILLNVAALTSANVSYYGVREQDWVDDVWLGAGCRVAGVGERDCVEELAELAAGRDPSGTRTLYDGGSYGDRRRTMAYDAVFAAPKSVSLLALLGDESTAAAVRAAHLQAARSGFGYLERQASAVVRRVGGERTFVDSAGFVAVAFTHVRSRSDDPHLHLHAVFPNMGQGPDHRWTAFNSGFIWANARTAGSVYGAELRYQLTARLGVGWEPVHKGLFELSGIPGVVRHAFSRRSQQVTEALQRRGIDSEKASHAQRRLAQLGTRQAKEPAVELSSLVERWRERADSLGLTGTELASVTGRNRVPVVDYERLSRLVEVRLASERAIGGSERALGRAAVRIACEELPAGADPAGVEALACNALRSRLVVQARSLARESGRDLALSL